MQDAQLASIATRYGIRMLLRFGSTVSGKTHDGSDVDLAADVERGDIPWREFADMVAGLQALFPGREVDVVLISRADPLLLRKIAENCELLYGSQRLLHEYKIHAFKRYQDHRRYLEMERAYVDRCCSRSPR